MIIASSGARRAQPRRNANRIRLDFAALGAIAVGRRRSAKGGKHVLLCLYLAVRQWHVLHWASERLGVPHLGARTRHSRGCVYVFEATNTARVKPGACWLSRGLRIGASRQAMEPRQERSADSRRLRGDSCHCEIRAATKRESKTVEARLDFAALRSAR